MIASFIGEGIDQLIRREVVHVLAVSFTEPKHRHFLLFKGMDVATKDQGFSC
jgi:hypothetical protein